MGTTQQKGNVRASRGRATADFGAEQILAALPKLNQADLTKIQQHTTVLLGKKGPENAEPHGDLHFVYDCMLRALSIGGTHLTIQPFQQFKAQHRGHLKELEKTGELLKLLASHAGVTKKVEKQQLYVVCFSALHHWLLKQYKPAGPVAMFVEHRSIYDAIDAAFPGYLESGLLGAVIKQKTELEVEHV